MMCVWGAGERGEAVVGGSDGVAGFIIDGSGGCLFFISATPFCNCTKPP